MSTFSGKDGLLVLGGYVDGSPLAQGSVASAAATMNIDAVSASLYGCILTGDTFAFATGAGTYTVTNGPYLIASGSCTAITFTPVNATVVADNAAITFTARTVLNATRWSWTGKVAALDDTVLSDLWRSSTGGLASWTGEGEAWLDSGDAVQAALLTNVASATNTVTARPCTFRVGSIRQFYGSGVITSLVVTDEVGALVKVTFALTGDGSIIRNWSGT